MVMDYIIKVNMIRIIIMDIMQGKVLHRIQDVYNLVHGRMETMNG